jgi:hypothetical protein
VHVEVIALGLTALVHVLGAIILVWAMLDGEEEVDWRGWWPRDDDGRGPDLAPEPQAPEGGLPLPDAVPSAVRLRTPARLAEAHPRPPRRPDHAPERTRPRTPAQ